MLNRMKGKVLFSIVLISMCPILANVAVAASSIEAQWTSPDTVTKEEVFNAALSAGTDSDYTLVSNDRTAGIISFKKEMGGGKSGYENRLNVKIHQEGDKVVVNTKSSGIGGFALLFASEKVLKERIQNFHAYLFRELKITDPSQRNISLKEE
jgi:hypothetical protein